MTEKTENKERGRTVLISLHIPRGLFEEIEKLVEVGYFSSRSEAVRIAIYYMLRDINRQNIFKPKMLPEAEVGYR